MKAFRRSRRRSSERGQALVEFALVGIIFFMFLFGLMEGTRAVWQYNTVAHAAREGTRYAIVHGSESSDPSGPASTVDIQDAVLDAAPNLSSGDVTVDVDYVDGSNDPGDKVEVEVRFDFSPMFFSVMPSLTMHSTSTMTIVH